MNKYNPNIHNRKSIRLKGYDYTQKGLYFVTICVQHRDCLFGEITNGELALNDAGQMIASEWLKLPERFPNIQIHEHIVMPNHFHAILEIVGATLVVAQTNSTMAQNDGQPQNGQSNQGQPNQGQPNQGQPNQGQPQGIAPTETGKTLGDMVGAFQSITTVEYIRGVKTKNWKPFDGKLWQRNYWEHIIRNEKSYETISEYILNNPTKWAEDKFYTA